jgi:predicted permease
VPLLTAFTDVIGPVLLIGLAGYLLGRIGAEDTRALTSLAANILVPALMFSALDLRAAQDHSCCCVDRQEEPAGVLLQ